MRSHTINDSIVTPEEVRQGEIVLNNHTRQWIRICNIGGNQGHIWRVNRVLISTYNTIPPLMGLRKDHKGDLEDNPILGPKMRPLCPANIAPNAGLGGLMAKVIKILANDFEKIIL